jgi:hypothetical protein
MIREEQTPMSEDVVAHLACAQLFENGELSDRDWDSALRAHRASGRSILALLLERGLIGLARLKQVCPNWVEAPRAVAGTPTDDLLNRHLLPVR